MVEALGFLLSIAGAILGLLGALTMAHSYHPFSLSDFAKQGIRLVWKLFRQDLATVVRSVEIASKLGAVNNENRGYSLFGLYLVFWGFCLQLFGAVVSFIAARS